MQVVIDVSVIGLGQLYETARTGIYRVISCLSEELLARRDCDILFSSLSSLEVNQLTYAYFARRNLADNYLPENHTQQILRSLGSTGLFKDSKNLVNRVLSKGYRMSRVRSICDQADVFHSHYSVLPQFSCANRLVRILTIYDLIPVLFPHYFTEEFIDQFKGIVHSIDVHRDWVFTISESSKNDICDYFGIAEERVVVTPLAANRALYQPVTDPDRLAAARRQLDLPEGEYFLTIATVEPRKNLELSMQAFKEVLLQTGHDDLYFIMVGTKGWKVEQLLETIANDPVLHNKIHFTGYVADSLLSCLYSGATAFVYPSLYEGFGLPPLEAMQCGTPVITSNTSSLPEVVQDAGIMVDPTDRDQLSQAMLDLLSDPVLQEMYRTRGIEQAKKFSWQRCADVTVAGYKAAAGSVN